MKKFITMMMVLMLTFSMIGCSSNSNSETYEDINNSPKEVVEAFIKSIDQTNSKLFLQASLSPENEKNMHKEDLDKIQKGTKKFLKELKEQSNESEDKIDFSKIEVLDPENWEDKEEVEIRLDLGGEETSFLTVKENGKWYMDHQVILAAYMLGGFEEEVKEEK